METKTSILTVKVTDDKARTGKLLKTQIASILMSRLGLTVKSIRVEVENKK